MGHTGAPTGIKRWHWLLAPSLADAGFAFRTSCAAILSLLIAMWLELGSPQWAPLSVWVVATASRGESLSKARWRLLGTVVGCGTGVALIAAFPQETLLFFIGLALWTAFCCGMATFMDGYRSYGFLVAGFTAAIVTIDVIPDPNKAFSIAMARGTYIELGIVCEALLTALCSPGLHDRARRTLLVRLQTSIASTRTMLEKQRKTVDPAADNALLSDIMAASARIEFDVLELGPSFGHAADHARAAISELLAAIAWTRAGGAGGAVEARLLSASRHTEAIEHPSRRDSFRFPARSTRQATDGLRNALRVATGIMAAALLWIVTAWPSGIPFMFNVVLVYGLLATREMPALASADFAKGAFWCAAVAALYVVLIIPTLTSPEMLAFVLLIPMVIGGLAARTPRLVNHAFSFNMFLPVLIGPANEGRYDEIAFLNTTMAFLAAVLFAGMMFRTVLIFRPADHLRRTLLWAERTLERVATPGNRTTNARWLLSNADSLVRAVRRTGVVPLSVKNAYFARHMAIMVEGSGLITLRYALTDSEMPPILKRRITLFLRKRRDDRHSVRERAPRLLRCIERDLPDRPDLAAAMRAIMSENSDIQTAPVEACF